MNVKLDDYEVRVLINGLMQQHRSYDAETNGQIDALALRLCDIAEAMKPGRKKKISFEPVEIRVIRHCLIEWRGRKTRCGGCLKRTADMVYPLKRKVVVTDGGFSFSGSIQEVIKFRE